MSVVQSLRSHGTATSAFPSFIQCSLFEEMRRCRLESARNSTRPPQAYLKRFQENAFDTSNEAQTFVIQGRRAKEFSCHLDRPMLQQQSIPATRP